MPPTVALNVGFDLKLTLQVSLAESGHVVLKLYDADAKEIRIAFDEEVPAGTNSVDFLSDEAADFFRLEIDGEPRTGRMPLGG